MKNQLYMPHQQEAGFNLIELLIGLFVSLFIGTIAITYLVSSSRTLTVQNSEDLAQENARFALELMSSNLRLAGMHDTVSAQSTVHGMFTDAICSGADCNTNSLNYSVSYEGTSISYNSDRVATDYVGNNTTTCTGNSVTSERKIVTVFYVDDLDNDGVASLYCQAYEAALDSISLSYETADFNPPPNNPVPLIDGVDSLQIQYGLDLDEDGDIDRYSAYSNVSAANTDKVRALRIGLLVNSGQQIGGDKSSLISQERTYNVLDSQFVVTDGILRQTFSTTVFLPNLGKI